MWEAAGYPWSVRLKAILPTWMRWIRKRIGIVPEAVNIKAPLRMNLPEWADFERR